MPTYAYRGQHVLVPEWRQEIGPWTAEFCMISPPRGLSKTVAATRENKTRRGAGARQEQQNDRGPATSTAAFRSAILDSPASSRRPRAGILQPVSEKVVNCTQNVDRQWGPNLQHGPSTSPDAFRDRTYRRKMTRSPKASGFSPQASAFCNQHSE